MDINNISYDALPDYMQGGMRRWIEHAIMPGGFLSAVLRNDLKMACMHADETNINLLPVYVRWLYNEAPIGSWGSPEKVDSWKGTVAYQLTSTLKSV